MNLLMHVQTAGTDISLPNILSYLPTGALGAEAASLKERGKAIIHSYAFSTTTHTRRTLEERFTELAANWKNETSHDSSIQRITFNPSYLEIIALGEKALPYIFKELREKPDYWFMALKIITGVDPVPKEDRGDVEAMTRYWLDWAEQNKYVTSKGFFN
jgi:hypothetical protein